MENRNDINYRNGILITGAMGGLGLRLVRHAQKIPDVDITVAADIRENIGSHFAGAEKVMPFVMDVGSRDSIQPVKDEIHSQGIRIKYIINNAGAQAFFPVSESTEELLDRIVRVNVYGQILTVSSFLDDLIETRGRVVQLSSDSVRLPIPFFTYPASKMALEAFSVSMRRELQLYGIKLILVRPGAMETPFLDAMSDIRNEVAESRYVKWFENFARMSSESVGKRSDPDEVAQIIIKALQVKKPKLVYSVNKNKKISFFSYFPEKMKDRLIRKSVS